MGTLASQTASGINSAVGAVTLEFGAVTGWWFIPIVIGMFIIGIAVSLIAGFFGKRKKRRK